MGLKQKFLTGMAVSAVLTTVGGAGSFGRQAQHSGYLG